MLEHVSRPHTAESVIDKLPMTGLHKKIVTTVSVIFFFEFADLNTFAYAAPALRRHEGYALADIAVVTSAGFLGMFLGAVGAGRLADQTGPASNAVLRHGGLFGLLSPYCRRGQRRDDGRASLLHGNRAVRDDSCGDQLSE